MSDRPDPSKSIYIYEFDPVTGALKPLNILVDVVNPSYLTISSDKRHLFAVNELLEFDGAPGGGVSSFTVTSELTEASFINSQPTHGGYPCYLTLDPTGHWLLVANYGANQQINGAMGCLSVFPVAQDGRLGEATTVIQHPGPGTAAHPVRQTVPHSHSVIFDPQQKYVLAADLGLDQILIFKFDAATGQLTPNDVAAIDMETGAGPRHLEFHPNGHYLYVTYELKSAVGVYAYDAEHGTLRHLQTISMIPADFVAVNINAELHISRSGLFLYASNRGHDSIAVFAIDPATGLLSLIEIVPSGGQHPRNFAFDLTGNYLLVANRDDNNLIVFQVDQTTGRLTRTAETVSIPCPVFVKVIDG
jgi:6-phosphogluconolactonase